MNGLFLFFLGIIQGVTELFPVSSLGHTLLVPGILGIHLDEHAPQLIPFLVALHLGTAVALLWYFKNRWIQLVKGFCCSCQGKKNTDGNLMWTLIVGTIPAGLVGLILEKKLETVFHDLRIVAVALIINGILLWWGERFTLKTPNEGESAITLKQGFLIGLAQILALIPGFSRSGVTMIAGGAAGLSSAAAAEFSFLLGTPIILAAGVLELPKLFAQPSQLLNAIIGGVLTGLAAWFSLRFLMKFFEEKGRLSSFGVYCICAGILALAWFVSHPSLATA
ncbi:Undecaprenyl-diphosphatase [Halomonadaceae bacterium LMG 33818]|uniref:undecaprenyl-diphosphate phosphatase n=1 Tax=Cernens ardua TaxID=3402176 RepID=UPI003EDCA059